MQSLNINPQEGKPLMSFFLQPFPASIYKNDDEMVFNPILQINESVNGIPLYTMARFSKPPTSCNTPGHTLKGGYSKSGKWKPAKWVPGKTDKRAGK